MEEKALQNEYIRKAIDLCFWPIIKEWGPKCAIEGILLLLLANIVYHSEYLLSFIAGNSAHPFLSIPVLQQIDLRGGGDADECDMGLQDITGDQIGQ